MSHRFPCVGVPLFTVVLLAIAGLSAHAATVTITVQGTVLSGTDTTGVFGFGPNANLAGKPYTLTFTFNDALGKEQFTSTASYIASTSTSDPGAAVLQIGEGSFAFGTSSRSASRAQLTTDGVGNSSYYLQAGEAVLDTSWNNIQGTVYPASGTLLTTSAIWEAPFSNVNLYSVKPPNTYYSFTFGVSELVSNKLTKGASGYLTATSIQVSGPEAESSALEITTLSIPAATAGHSYDTIFSYSGGQGAVTWKGTVPTGSRLPAGFSLSKEGLLTSTGTPVASAGDYPLTIVATDATGKQASKLFHLTIVSPTCAELVHAAVQLQLCHPGSTVAECKNLKSPAMWATFKPQSGDTLSEAASTCGFKGFNWQQWVTSLPAPSPFSTVEAPKVSLLAPPVFLDPPTIGGYVSPATAGAFPFFYSSSEAKAAEIDAYTFYFVDPPHDNCLPGGSGAACSGKTANPGGYMGFQTSLVGILPSGQPSAPLYTWTWMSTYNGTNGDVYLLSQ